MTLLPASAAKTTTALTTTTTASRMTMAPRSLLKRAIPLPRLLLHGRLRRIWRTSGSPLSASPLPLPANGSRRRILALRLPVSFAVGVRRIPASVPSVATPAFIRPSTSTQSLRRFWISLSRPWRLLLLRRVCASSRHCFGGAGLGFFLRGSGESHLRQRASASSRRLSLPRGDLWPFHVDHSCRRHTSCRPFDSVGLALISSFFGVLLW